eukprot:TRINITY_DN627_c0_g1_i1.p1 TRINITY_DN627_c0_g1~~TRINITY_DN627_c0_g1_i1.p1  ORF type:complete len:152 (+),score=29.19 TRINITY_DN627_c0_g1_i1:192-647(+)
MDAKEAVRKDRESLATETTRGALVGAAGGSIWGCVLATWNDLPKVEKNIVWPGLKRTFQVMGDCGFTYAAIGAIFCFTDHVSEKLRNKKDFWNGTIGGFVAGATVFGLRGRSVASALKCGSALALTAAIVDGSGGSMRVNNEIKDFPYDPQ